MVGVSFGSEKQVLCASPHDPVDHVLTTLERMRNLAILARGTTIAFINSAGVRWLKYNDAGDLVGKPLALLLNADYRDILNMGLEMLSEEHVIPLKLERQDGGEIDVELWVEPFDIIPGDVFLIEARDITEHLRAARALRSREQRLEGIIRTVADGIITIDDKGIVQTFNPAAEKIFKFSADEILGKSIRTLVPAPVSDKLGDGTEIEWQKLLKQEQELKGRRKDGCVFPMEMMVRELVQGDTISFTSIVRDLSARKRAEERIRHMAHHDALTGLPNRFLFGDRLDEAVRRAARHGALMAVVFIDLNKFKPVNDIYGHMVGDRVLVGVTASMRVALRQTDTLARVGGDEFVAILEDVKGREQVEKIIKKLIAAANAPIPVDGTVHRIGVSCGASLFVRNETEEVLIEHADAAMYNAKKTGKNAFAFHGEAPVVIDME